ncbi:MAG TPA: recombinase family protein [Pirellulales bacterium]|jgi:DNA invertase Pin-like site-specific DNA recombinase|nr:recombinase family protein [Pirellulales bacterium]
MIQAATKRVPATIAATAYYRMSTDRQDKSIGEQREAVERFAREHGYRIIRTYRDEGISGDKTEKRLGFRQMITDAQERGDFELILAWDQDRFGRFNSIEAGHWIYPLMQAGIRLETIAQGKIDWNDFSGRLMYQIQQEGKHQFLRDLARNSLRGLISRAKTGKWCGGPPAFGYEIGEDEHLQFGNPAHVAAVREVFQLRLQGMGYRTIANQLNAKGTPSPSGKKWSHDAVRIVLGRETYLGIVSLGGRKQGKYFTASDDLVTAVVPGKNQPTRATRTENAHPAIIDQETFDAAQAMRRSHPKPHWRKESQGTPLAGLLYCGRCGKVMYGQSLQRKAGQKFPNYICSTYHKGRGCGYCSVQQEAILRTVAQVIRERVVQTSYKDLQKAIAREIERRAAQAEVVDDQGVQRQIAALDKKIENATERLVSVDDSLVATVEKKLIEMRRERDGLAAKLAPVTCRQEKLDPKQVAAKIKELEEILANGSPAKVRQALSKIVSRITLDFTPSKQTKRGQKFAFVNGTIELCTQQCGSPATNH